jgi:hypothetical protein
MYGFPDAPQTVLRVALAFVRTTVKLTTNKIHSQLLYYYYYYNLQHYTGDCSYNLSTLNTVDYRYQDSRLNMITSPEDKDKETELSNNQEILPQSRVPEIWQNFHRRLNSIDELEKRLDEHVKRFRRRVTCAVDQEVPYRRSHLRFFVTHKREENEHEAKMWTLVVEGKLLVGLLDHASAQRVDKHGAFVYKSGGEEGRDADIDINIKPSSVLPTVPEPGAADGAEGGGSSRSDRNRYRSVGDVEEDPIEPTLFTHAFDRLEASFQTIWQPETPPQSTSNLTPPKKSRKRKVETPQPSNAINPKYLRSSKATNISWTKKQSNDSHAFHIKYAHVEAPQSMKFHSVIATIVANPTHGETMYRPSAALAEKFFPKHVTSTNPRVTKRRKSAEDGAVIEEDLSIPLENEIHVPSHLTLNEILMCLLQYITDKKLQDEGDKSLIICDKLLSGLLECESLNFGDLQSTLLAKGLIAPLQPEEDPIVLTYILQTSTTSPQVFPAVDTVAELPEGHHHQVLSFDMDVCIPSFFHWRAREIMRRIKRREFEYTSSRTKGRYMLVASRGNEDVVKTKIGECISGHGYAEENIPIFLALAKAAPPNSEARGAAQTDAKTCTLVGRLDECTRQVQAVWDLVEDCRRFLT